MSSVLVICPTRGRPGAALEVQTSFQTTRVLDSKLLFVVDHDDPQRSEYEALDASVVVLEQDPPGNMVKALNAAASVVLGLEPAPAVLGFVGDDHRFRSHGWDMAVMTAMERMGGSGLVFGNDKAHSDSNLPEGDLLPTQVFISSAIVRALGYFALPTCRHLYVDNGWKTLGQGLGKLAYDPRVVIEHLHPAYGKGEWDEGHIRVNSTEMYDHDRQAFEAWLAGSSDPSYITDIEKVRAIL